MKPLSPARRASLGMTAVLCVAIAAGASSALFNAHASPASPVRPERPAVGAVVQPSAPTPDQPSSALSGSVLETFPASQYTYLHLATSNGKIWAAVPSASIAVGARVIVENAARMTAFKSATLKRTFDVIYFGTLATDNAPNAAAPRFSPADALANDDEQDLPPGHPNIENSEVGARGSFDSSPSGYPELGGAAASPHGPSPSAASTLPEVAIAPARGSNAHSISQLSARRTELAGQRIRVRGQVTKVTAGVQGRTFFHLRDGQPGAKNSETDLVVTSQATPERGQVATFEGTLRADADVGIGFKYPILLESALLIAE